MHLPAEKALEGKYVIQTEELDLSAVQAVEAYKELSEVERGFRELKDLIEMRPIYHHRPKRVRAHIFVAALAFLLACVMLLSGIFRTFRARHYQRQSPKLNNKEEAIQTLSVAYIQRF